MNLEITPQLKAYLEANGKIVLNACPGSGKTTAIAQKIINLAPQYKIKYGNHSGIACLSFTNAAKSELSEKYKELSSKPLLYPNLVSTIDSFINVYITLPFYYLLERNFARPRILDNDARLDLFWKVKYEYKGKLIDGVTKKMNEFKARDKRSIYYLYPPSQIRLEPNGSFSVKGNPPSEDKVDLNVFKEYCQYIKRWQFEKGLITTNDSAYIALVLLRKNVKIGTWLVQRFPHIFIDEAQDNSLMQHQIFEVLQSQGLKNIEFIGDPYQSLYEFRDADPKLFIDKFNNNEYIGLELTDNRRSPQHIINCFSLLRPDDESIINSSCKENLKEPILIYRYDSQDRSAVINHYDNYCFRKDFFNRKVVVRGNSIRNKMLGRSAVQKPWNSDLPYKLIAAKIEYEDYNLKEAINIIRSVVIDLEHSKLHHSEKAKLKEELSSDYKNNARLIKLLKKLPNLSLTVAEWSELCPTFLNNNIGIDTIEEFKLKRASKYFDKKTRDEPVSDHFNRVDIARVNTLTTVHQVKGKTLDAILVFFDEKNHSKNINFKDIAPEKNAFISEKKRIIYVAMSRPKHLLAMAFPSTISEKEIKKKFGEDIKIINSKDIMGLSN